MQMPQPTPEHRKLEALAGDWVGEEILHPSPWAPERRTAIGRFCCRIGVDGMFLVSDYEEERDGKVVFRGHGVYGWDAKRARYTMFWFDSMGMSPNETLGVWEGDELVFSGSGEGGSSRYVYTVKGADRMAFRIEASRDGSTWNRIMEGEYVRRA
jgi:hypothetical protein